MSDSDETMDMDSESLFFRIRNLWAGASDKMDGAGDFVHDMVENPFADSTALCTNHRAQSSSSCCLGHSLSANIQSISNTKLTVMLKFISPMERSPRIYFWKSEKGGLQTS